MGETHNNNAANTADYLAQLLKDKKQLAAFPNVFLHLERLLDDGKYFGVITLLIKIVHNYKLFICSQ